MDPQPVTMTALARSAGVHVSTVSRALRGEPGIPAATRARVRALADKLGYRPDPALAALNAYRRTLAPTRYQAALAVLAATRRWEENPASGFYLKGAQQRAAELGYKLEQFILDPPDMSGKRIAGVLRARHIRGVLVLPLPAGISTLDFPWTEFTPLAFGFTLAEPALNRISINHFGAMIMALTRAHALGYRRPGLWLNPDTDVPERMGATEIGRLWEGAYRTETARLFPAVQIPILREEPPAALKEWIQVHQPDVILTQHPEPEACLRAAGLRAPRHVGLVHTRVDGNQRLSGIHQNSILVGRRATDILVGMLHHHETGIPAVPVDVLVEARWEQGRTVRAAAPRAARRLPAGK